MNEKITTQINKGVAKIMRKEMKKTGLKWNYFLLLGWTTYITPIERERKFLQKLRDKQSPEVKV